MAQLRWERATREDSQQNQEPATRPRCLLSHFSGSRGRGERNSGAPGEVRSHSRKVRRGPEGPSRSLLYDLGWGPTPPQSGARDSTCLPVSAPSARIDFSSIRDKETVILTTGDLAGGHKRLLGAQRPPRSSYPTPPPRLTLPGPASLASTSYSTDTALARVKGPGSFTSLREPWGISALLTLCISSPHSPLSVPATIMLFSNICLLPSSPLTLPWDPAPTPEVHLSLYIPGSVTLKSASLLRRSIAH